MSKLADAFRRPSDRCLLKLLHIRIFEKTLWLTKTSLVRRTTFGPIFIGIILRFCETAHPHLP